MSILQSLKPQYCELIASGKKQIVISEKGLSKYETPVRVYIYQNCNKWLYKFYKNSVLPPNKVIGEYVCNCVDSYYQSDTNKAYYDLSEQRLFIHSKTLCDCNDIKVIGNVYDNPELLEVTE